MKIKIDAGLVNVLGLTADEFDAMLGVVEAVDRQCFFIGNRDEASGIWHSSGSPSLPLTDSQRSALATLGSRIRDIYNS